MAKAQRRRQTSDRFSRTRAGFSQPGHASQRNQDRILANQARILKKLSK